MQADEVQIVVPQGQVSDDVKQRAQREIADLERYAPREFLFARVEFSRRGSRAPTTSTQVLLDVQGNIVQARSQAPQPDESFDRVRNRVAQSLHRLTERLQDRRHEPATVPEGEWRHGALPTQRPDHFPRPPEEREVVERVTHASGPASPEEAAFDLEMLEDDWLLYVADASRTDAVIRRLEDEDAFGVSVVDAAPVISGDGPYDLRPDASPPALTIDDAIERLDVGDEPHVFFVDAANDRGAVVYRRYDGHYGLVRPRDLAPQGGT